MALRKRARSNVVSLHGATIPGSREPDQDVISQLERLLSKARDGEVHGMAYVVICDQDMTTGWCGNAESYRQLAGAAMLNYRLANAIDEA